MSDHPDRDRSIERLLRQTPLASSMPSAACVDAERLAAWAEGSLRPEAAKQVETHLADCERCQAMAAVFVESAPARPTVVPFWKHWSVRWLLPLWAASAFVLAWALVVDEQPDEPATTIARVEPAEVPPVLVPEPDVSQPAPTVEQPAAPQQAPMAARQDAAAPPPPSAPLAAPSDAQDQATGAPVPPALRSMAPAGDRPPAPARAESGQNNVMMDGIAALDQGAPHARVQGQEPVEFEAPRTSPAAEPGLLAVQTSPPRWRISPDGRVDRSVDSGTSWNVVPLSPPSFIIAGSAPATGVCWLTGREGAVFRSIDGATFQRTAFPEPIALVSVQAVDAMQATIVADDGRVFTTTNGGAAWRELP